MRYQVRFQRGGETRYGIVRSYGDDVDAAKARGLLIVEDAVLPVVYEVHEVDVTDLPVEMPKGPYNMATGEWEGLGEYDAHVQAAHKAAKAASEAVVSGIGVGSMFSIGVGDGSAHYVVTKVNKRTCRVEWRGFCADRWTDHRFGCGGTFPLAEVTRYVDGERRLSRIFARRSS